MSNLSFGGFSAISVFPLRFARVLRSSGIKDFPRSPRYSAHSAGDASRGGGGIAFSRRDLSIPPLRSRSCFLCVLRGFCRSSGIKDFPRSPRYSAHSAGDAWTTPVSNLSFGAFLRSPCFFAFCEGLPKLWDQGFSSIPALFRAFCGRCFPTGVRETGFFITFSGLPASVCRCLGVRFFFLDPRVLPPALREMRRGGRGNRIFSPRSVVSPSPLEVALQKLTTPEGVPRRSPPQY